MSEVQGDDIAVNEVQATEIEAEQVAADNDNADAVADVEESTQEPVEVDYEAEYAKAKQANDAMQKKIDRQRAASSQHNAKIQELNEQLAKLQKVDAPTEPQIDDFETHDEYVNALADFRADKVVQEKQQAMLAQQQQQAIEQREAEQKKVFDQQEAAYKLENPDYERAKTELADHLQLNPISHQAQNVIYDAAELTGNIPALIDYFGKDGGANLAEWDRVSSLPPLEAAYEVFKIANGFNDAPKQNVKEKKPLPKPLKKTDGTASKVKKSPKDLSEADFRKWLNG